MTRLYVSPPVAGVANVGTEPVPGRTEYVRAEAWVPIETADKSGEILIYCEKTGEQFVAFWGTDPEDGDTQWVFARGNGISFIVRDPTHWQPLPPPPLAKESDQ